MPDAFIFPIADNTGRTMADVPRSGGSPNSRNFGGPRGATRIHVGIDIPAEHGAVVVAIGDGEIVRSDNWDANGYGNVVDIRYADGTVHRNAHLDTREVEVGDTVYAGQVVGTVGVTGNASQNPNFPHVHYEVIWPESYNSDPSIGPLSPRSPGTSVARLYEDRMDPRDYFAGVDPNSILHLGMTPDHARAVMGLQNALNAVGFDLPVDGDFGTATQEALQEYQEATGNLVFNPASNEDEATGVLDLATRRSLVGAQAPEYQTFRPPGPVPEFNQRIDTTPWLDPLFPVVDVVPANPATGTDLPSWMTSPTFAPAGAISSPERAGWMTGPGSLTRDIVPDNLTPFVTANQGGQSAPPPLPTPRPEFIGPVSEEFPPPWPQRSSVQPLAPPLPQPNPLRDQGFAPSLGYVPVTPPTFESSPLAQTAMGVPSPLAQYGETQQSTRPGFGVPVTPLQFGVTPPTAPRIAGTGLGAGVPATPPTFAWSPLAQPSNFDPPTQVAAKGNTGGRSVGKRVTASSNPPGGLRDSDPMDVWVKNRTRQIEAKNAIPTATTRTQRATTKAAPITALPNDKDTPDEWVTRRYAELAKKKAWA